MQLKKVFPIYEGAELRRRWTHEAEWQDWLRAHGAYGFRVAPYYNRCVVVFGEKRYVEVIKQLYGLDESEYVAGVGGMVVARVCTEMPLEYTQRTFVTLRALWSNELIAQVSNESIVKELFSMSENRRRRALVDLVADYHKNSSLAKAGRNRGTTVQDIADSLVDEASIVKLLKDIHNLSFTSPLYGVYRNPDFGRDLPDVLPLLAFDNQPLNAPLDLARIS